MDGDKRLKSIYNLLIIALLLLAVAIRGGATFEWLKPNEAPLYTMTDVQTVFPKASGFDKESDNSLSVYDKDDRLLGYALVSSDFEVSDQGYGGAVPILIALNTDKIVTAVHLLKHNETGDFIKHLQKKGLLDSWNQLPLDTLLSSFEVDAVSGATKSSQAIIRTFRSTVNEHLNTASSGMNISVMRVLQLFAMLLLIAFSLLMMFRKRFRKLYIYYLGGVVLVMGLWLNKMLSLELLHVWLSSSLSWQSNWELIIILLLTLVLALRGYKNYYCTYLCPMGAVQILTARLSPFKKRALNLKVSVFNIRLIYLSLIAAGLIIGYSLPLAHLEPFMAFSYQVASVWLLAAAALIVILSLFFHRPWCQLCPTGCLLNTIPALHKKRKT
ncbi:MULTISPECIES: 4Fe-4S binding protein [unclassified Carboxylicivirga]|uniref:4Fe-4S binding protein n=1 Tax=Carboxylicivirga TaxID=1628153 RepID=UPI003D3556E2